MGVSLSEVALYLNLYCALEKTQKSVDTIVQNLPSFLGMALRGRILVTL